MEMLFRDSRAQASTSSKDSVKPSTFRSLHLLTLSPQVSPPPRQNTAQEGLLNMPSVNPPTFHKGQSRLGEVRRPPRVLLSLTYVGSRLLTMLREKEGTLHIS